MSRKLLSLAAKKLIEATRWRDGGVRFSVEITGPPSANVYSQPISSTCHAQPHSLPCLLLLPPFLCLLFIYPRRLPRAKLNSSRKKCRGGKKKVMDIDHCSARTNFQLKIHYTAQFTVTRPRMQGCIFMDSSGLYVSERRIASGGEVWTYEAPKKYTQALWLDSEQGPLVILKSDFHFGETLPRGCYIRRGVESKRNCPANKYIVLMQF